MKLVMTRGGLRHLVAESADDHTLCGRECSAWEGAPEQRMRDVPSHRHCVNCWHAASKAKARLHQETWPDGAPVYPLDLGQGGSITAAEVKRLRKVHAELEQAERERMREVRGA